MCLVAHAAQVHIMVKSSCKKRQKNACIHKNLQLACNFLKVNIHCNMC